MKLCDDAQAWRRIEHFPVVGLPHHLVPPPPLTAILPMRRHLPSRSKGVPTSGHAARTHAHDEQANVREQQRRERLRLLSAGRHHRP